MTTSLSVQPLRARRAVAPLLAVAVLALVLAASAFWPAGSVGTDASADTVEAADISPTDSVILTAAPNRIDELITTVEDLGGTAVDRIDEMRLLLVTGMDSQGIAELTDLGLIEGASINATADLTGAPDWSNGDARMLARRPGSGYHLAESTGAIGFHERGFNGNGIGIALIDSGVANVPGLDRPGQVLDLADLTLRSPDNPQRFRDCYGHGTHLAGLLSGGDLGIKMDREWSVGLAPGSHIVNIRIADCEGRTDIWSVIRGVKFALYAQSAYRIEVVVLALSVPTDTPYQLDPLSAAVEWAWDAGMTVVVAAGNDGVGSPVTSPGTNPFVITVGGSDHADTTETGDNRIATFSSTGTPGGRRPDLIAPARAIISLRAPDSKIDTSYAARVKDSFTRGSGTSQAAAIVAGAVALLLDERPDLTPDQVKAILSASASPLAGADADYQGAGQLDLTRASAIQVPAEESRQSWPKSTWREGDPVPDDLVTPSGNRWAGNRWATGEWH